MASGEKASQSCLCLDTLLICTPFSRLYACLSLLLCLSAGKGLQDTCIYLSFCCLLVSQESCFPNFHYHPIVPFIQEVEEGDGEMGKWGERNIAR